MKEKKPVNLEIGRQVKQCREEAGLTQEAFAELIGLGVKHVSAMECGAVGVSLVTLRRISRALSVPADRLLFGESEEAERQSCDPELQALVSRLSRLPPGKFKAAKEMIAKLLEALAVE